MRSPTMTDDRYIKIGHLKGITIWCSRCGKQTDHNGPWHLEYFEQEPSR